MAILDALRKYFRNNFFLFRRYNPSSTHDDTMCRRHSVPPQPIGQHTSNLNIHLEKKWLNEGSIARDCLTTTQLWIFKRHCHLTRTLSDPILYQNVKQTINCERQSRWIYNNFAVNCLILIYELCCVFFSRFIAKRICNFNRDIPMPPIDEWIGAKLKCFKFSIETVELTRAIVIQSVWWELVSDSFGTNSVMMTLDICERNKNETFSMEQGPTMFDKDN